MPSYKGVLSKVFECILAKHLDAYAETNDLFPSLQFGFRKGLGTCDALLTITSVVQKSLNTGCLACMIGLDFGSAFDSVSHGLSSNSGRLILVELSLML